MALQAFPSLPDEVESAFQDRMRPAHPRLEGRVGHAFLLDLEHGPLGLEGIFAASEAFDLHDAVPGRGHLIVDVLEIGPSHTRLHIQPDGAVTFCDVAREVDALVQDVDRRVGGCGMRTSRLEWVVEPVGQRTHMPA